MGRLPAGREKKAPRGLETGSRRIVRYPSHPLPPHHGYNFYFLLEQASAERHLWHLQLAEDRQCLELGLWSCHSLRLR